MSRITDAVEAVSNAIISQRDYLTDLDREIGDGDHGINMARGFTAVKETIEAMDDDKDPKKILDAIGETLIMNVGGAAGPLFGSAFKKAAEACESDTTLTITNIERLLTAAIEDVKRRGRAGRNDKTILDALIPIHDAFLPENAGNKRLFEVLQDGLRAGREGVKHTKDIVARKGRAQLIGERSIGHEDPGAMSILVLYRAFYQFLKGNLIAHPRF